MREEVLRRRVKAASGRLKLKLLLMANCDMYQKDTADLLHAEVDWKAGTITRKRSKKIKGRDENLPTVTWYLWPSTLGLLREHATSDTPNVLANRNGVAGVRTDVRQDGSVARTDNARTRYERLQDALAKAQEAEIAKMQPSEVEQRVKDKELEVVDGKPVMRRWSLKHIRKCSATAIGNHPQYGRFAQCFLGQAPETVADANDVRPSEDQFRACCQWLGQHLGIDRL